MSDELAATLPSLPVEILYRIFDDLDASTILLSVSDVCQALRAAGINYHRYKLDFISLYKPDFHRLLRVTRPECVTALSHSNGEKTPEQIGLFLFLVEIGLFTRLRSWTLLHICWQDLCVFLKHAKRCSLTTLILISETLHFRGVNTRGREEAEQHLFSVLSQSSLLRLELLISDVSDLMEQLHWPIQYKLRYLQIASTVRKLLSKIITGSPDLEMLTFDDSGDLLSYYCDQPGEWFSTLCSQLTSLLLSNFAISMN